MLLFVAVCLLCGHTKHVYTYAFLLSLCEDINFTQLAQNCIMGVYADYAICSNLAVLCGCVSDKIFFLLDVSAQKK